MKQLKIFQISKKGSCVILQLDSQVLFWNFFLNWLISFRMR